MATTERWIANAPTVAQVDTFTLATYDVTTSNVMTIGAKAVTTADQGGTTTTSATAWAAAINAATAVYPEFAEGIWTSSGAVVTMTANVAGSPIGEVGTASGGTGTITAVNSVAMSSPSDINNALNWSNGAAPAAGDTVIIDAGNTPLLWNLSALSSVTVAALYRRKGHQSTIGLPEINKSGYWEYRATELTLGVTLGVVEINQTDQAAGIKLNFGSVQTALTITGPGQTQLGSEVVWWRGTHASNVVKVINGSLAIGVKNNLAATVATLIIEGSTCTIGQSVTLTTVSVLNSSVALYSGCTTLNATVLNGATTITVYGTAAVTTLNANSGTINWNSTGTIGTLTLGPNAKFDASQGAGNFTVTNAVSMAANSTFNDPLGRSIAGGLVITLQPGVTLEQVTINVGSPQRTYTVT